MLLPQIWTVTQPWATVAPVTATELEQANLGVRYAMQYNEHHAGIGGLNGVAYEGLKDAIARWLQSKPALRPVSE